jgi:histidine ammonia-lyase
MIMHIDLPAGELPAVVFGAGPVTLDEVVALATRRARPVLSGDPAFAERIELGAALLARLSSQDDGAAAGPLAAPLFTWQDGGLGPGFTPEQTRAILAARLASLSCGGSGAGMEQLRLLCDLLEHDVLPDVPHEGADTAAMTGLACLAATRAGSLCRLAGRITALAAVALDENARYFDEALFAAKPYPGTAQAAGWIRADLGARTGTVRDAQARDAIRCAPHVIGVLMDALPWMVEHIELELNSASGALLVDLEGKRLLQGGHHHGAHITYAMDGMKNAVGKLANLFEHQIALLADAGQYGLLASPRNPAGARMAVNHGLKALQHNVSAWTAEAHRLTPDTVFHRADIGTGAARDCLRVIELTEQIAAALLVAVRQACALRYPDGLPPQLGPGLLSCMERIAELVPFTGEERRLDHDLRRLLAVIRYDGAALLCRGAAEAAARG